MFFHLSPPNQQFTYRNIIFLYTSNITQPFFPSAISTPMYFSTPIFSFHFLLSYYLHYFLDLKFHKLSCSLLSTSIIFQTYSACSSPSTFSSTGPSSPPPPLLPPSSASQLQPLQSFSSVRRPVTVVVFRAEQGNSVSGIERPVLAPLFS